MTTKRKLLQDLIGDFVYPFTDAGAVMYDKTVVNLLVAAQAQSALDELATNAHTLGDTVADLVANGSVLKKSGVGFALANNTDRDTLGTNAVDFSYGIYTGATGDLSFAEGYSTIASGLRSHAEGTETLARAHSSHSEGEYSCTDGAYSHAEGSASYTGLLATAGHAEGSNTHAVSDSAHAEGYNTLAGQSRAARVTDFDNTAKTITLDTALAVPTNFIAGAKLTLSRDNASPLENVTIASVAAEVITLTTVETLSSHIYAASIATSGADCVAHAEGSNTSALGYDAHSEGWATLALGDYSHTEGEQSTALGEAAHAEGYQTVVDYAYGHAEGYGCAAASSGGAVKTTPILGDANHSEGMGSLARGAVSHAEGYSTVSGVSGGTEASFSSIVTEGFYTHAQNNGTSAFGNSSHAGGIGTTAKGFAQTTIGMWNVLQGSYTSKVSTDNAFIIGNGASNASRSNAFAVNWQGDVSARKLNGHRLKRNQSTASQSPAAATRTYLTGSNLNFLAGELAVGTNFHWVFDVTKTAAGTAASTIDICLGTAGSTTDTAIVSFAKPVGTAVVDNGKFEIDAVVRTVGASCVISGHMTMTHNLASTGLATIPTVDVTTISGSFDVSTATNIGLCLTTGASDAYTIQLVKAEAWNL